MCYALLVAVLESKQELLEEIPGKRLFKSSTDRNIIKQLSSIGQLQHDIGDLLLLTAILVIDVCPIINLLNDVRVFQVIHGLDLSENQLPHLFIHVVLNDLDSHSLSGLNVLAQLHFAAGAIPESLEDLEAS